MGSRFKKEGKGEKMERAGKQCKRRMMARKLTDDHNMYPLKLVSDIVLRALYTLSYLVLSHLCEVSAIIISSIFQGKDQRFREVEKFAQVHTG